MAFLHHASFGIGMLGVAVIVFGVTGGLVRFIRAEFLAVRGKDVEQDLKRLRHLLGYYLLCGLEFLIAADIIDTLMKPSVQDVIVLGAIVLIRTVISYSLNGEPKWSIRQKAQHHDHVHVSNFAGGISGRRAGVCPAIRGLRGREN